jgi:hypothetical protein
MKKTGSVKMNNGNEGFFRRDRFLASVSQRTVCTYLTVAGIAGVLLAAPHSARALNLYDGSQYGNNLEINLSMTFSYTGAVRVNNPSKILLDGSSNANGNDSDANFRYGLVNNLFDVLPVLDVRDGQYGAHVSGEAYLNTVYLGTNQNNQPGTLNSYSVAKNTDFTSATRNAEGQDARLLDAFVYGGHIFGDGQSLQLKFGRQTLLWGQSLFFAGNGIAAGQAPIDVIQAENLVNPEAQQVYMPIGQAVLTYNPIASLTIQGYYQFEWEPDNLQAAGAYFNSTDILDKGGQRIIVLPGTPNYYDLRIKDIRPPINNGQFGLAVQDTLGEYDVGIYALRYDSKTPEVYNSLPSPYTPTPGGLAVGYYRLVYPRDIWIYGTSLSTTLGPANVAGEVSFRSHMPLVGNSALAGYDPQNSINANAHPLYPIGDTMHAQASFIYVSPSLPLDPGGITWDGEVEFNHLLHVTENRDLLAIGRQASAAAFDTVITPTYNDVLPHLQLTFPIGLTYDVLGRSETDISMQHGNGVFNVGVTATYEENWIASVAYQDYLGKPNPVYNGLADRGYVTLNLQHTF